jgi:murein L,D-transpeptidase YafK
MLRIAVATVAVAAMALAAGPAGAAGKRVRDVQLAALTPPAYLKADRVVVFKRRHELVLMRNDRVLDVFTVALGRYAENGPKLREGDKRTPEGLYTLDAKLDGSNFYRAIRISYPNTDDRARARAMGVNPGGRIEIHGLPNGVSARYVGHPDIDWTDGCIAVTDRQMDRIWARVDVGTPIEIYP